MTPEWKAAVQRALNERTAPPMNRAQLADALHVTRGLITKMLEEQTVSALVDPICDLLGIAPPLERMDPRTARISAALAGRTDDEIDRLLRIDAAAAGVPDEIVAPLIAMLEAAKRKQ